MLLPRVSKAVVIGPRRWPLCPCPLTELFLGTPSEEEGTEFTLEHVIFQSFQVVELLNLSLVEKVVGSPGTVPGILQSGFLWSWKSCI